MTYGFTVGSRSRAGREDWKTYYDNSILVDGPEMKRIVDCAKEHSVYVSVGYSERDAVTATEALPPLLVKLLLLGEIE